ncbi:hypothetical protein [Mesorhizobium prunaredense]|uniref:hypothetical protein n=1 Tax=Mesorhizobium prunaredense TaxID=1631249 RepID=UPI00157D234C|nr:hypothetical protein [Mesorhizobium prunaredense]
MDGFLELRNGSGLHKIEHGVDLSHHNDRILYGELKRCGASFAILKMDKRFKIHKTELAGRDIRVIPYHYLSVVSGEGKDYTRRPKEFSLQATSEENRGAGLLRIAENMGKTKAARFISQYESALSPTERTSELSGLKGKLIVLDVEEYFKVRSTSNQRISFGRFYAAMLASWVKTVKSSYPDAKIIFYTFPDIYTSYLQFAFPSDHAVIHGMPVWLARTRGDASDFDLKSSKQLQRICLSSSGGNKCILHQYTHRATFGVPNITGLYPPLHIDVNRLFSAKEVQDGEGFQYVRAE